MLYLSLLPRSHYKKFEQLIYIGTGLEILDDRPKFSDTARCQERGSFVCKNRQTEEAKTKLEIFDLKIFTVFLKAIQLFQCNGALVK